MNVIKNYSGNMGTTVQTVNIKEFLMDGEQLIWSDKPQKKAFIINKSVVMMPFAIIWLVFDSAFISMFFSAGAPKEMLKFIIPFFAIHLFPVWIWLGNVLTAGKRWENTEYAVTDKRIIIRNGFLGYNYQSIYYTEISNVNLNVGIIDRMLGVGDIIISSSKSATEKFSILDITNVDNVFRMIQKTVLDIQSDIHYPNELRPTENKGYNTQYRP